jgi:hypothetical protein
MSMARKIRPVGVYFLVLLILLVACWNGLRFFEAILFWIPLKTYAASPLYIAISGGVWFLFGLFLAWSIWLVRAWSRWLAMLAAVGYTFWVWFDRLVVQAAHANWLFVLLTQPIYLLLVFSILLSKKGIRFFKRDTDERKPEAPKIA